MILDFDDQNFNSTEFQISDDSFQSQYNLRLNRYAVSKCRDVKRNIIFRIERSNGKSKIQTCKTRRMISFERATKGKKKEVFNYKLSKTYRISEKGNKAVIELKKKKDMIK